MAERSAEKPRIGSCSFANRVAKVSIEELRDIYTNLVLKDDSNANLDSFFATNPFDDGGKCSQTVLSAFLLHNGSNVDCFLSANSKLLVGSLIVISMGMGTKVLDNPKTIENQQLGNKVMDFHAEVLARRGLLRFFYSQLTILKSNLFSDLSSIFLISKDDINRVELREGITLHLYTSSAPCGNSCIRRGGTSKSEVYQTDLDENTWNSIAFSVKEPHPTYSRPLEEVAVLVKTCPPPSSCSTSADDIESTKQSSSPMITHSSSMKSKKNKAFVNSSDTTAGGYVPPGTSFPLDESRYASLHATCSDKIARWCYIGLEGALLSSFLKGPIRISSITCGRKFSRIHFERAFFGRVQGSFNLITQINEDGSVTAKKKKMKRPLYPENSFFTPTVLCTSVNLHKGAIKVEEGAKFEDVAMMSWLNYQNISERRKEIEIFQGTTGSLVYSSSSKVVDKSSVCRSSFLDLWKHLNKLHGGIYNVDETKMFFEQYREAKSFASEEFRNRSIEFLTQNIVFNKWPLKKI